MRCNVVENPSSIFVEFKIRGFGQNRVLAGRNHFALVGIVRLEAPVSAVNDGRGFEERRLCHISVHSVGPQQVRNF